MSKPEFTWKADLGAEKTVKPLVNQTRFGDGYELRTSMGINFKPCVWRVQFTRATTEAMEILAFLEARGGMESFTWTDPFDSTLTFVCREWSGSQQDFGLYNISAEFEQVFES